MAVPKKKTSKARRDKRRATHRLEAPRVNLCPQCGNPKQPHRMCPICKTYNGREVEPLHSRPRRPWLRIAVDAMGGDRAPEEVVAGALEARSDTIEPILFGPPGLDTGGLELVEAPDASRWTTSRPRPSARSRKLARHGEPRRRRGAGPTPSSRPGNTGAMLAAGLLQIRRLKGVHRPAIAVVLPARYGASVLIDAGANADSRPEHLVQFAHMGSIFAEEILGRANPEVRLLSIGEEPEKGNHLVLEAHALLAESGLNFKGNTEARDLLALRRRRRRHATGSPGTSP